jgi:hypothetical protein
MSLPTQQGFAYRSHSPKLAKKRGALAERPVPFVNYLLAPLSKNYIIEPKALSLTVLAGQQY